MQTVTLLIDKRRELSTKYKKLLENKNNKVLISKSLISSMKIIQDTEPDLIIISDSVDSDLADYCKKIRALTYNMRPVIVVTSKSDDLQDRLSALENGADDFISEPVNSDEFVMRVKAHLRRELESNMDAKHLLPSKNYSLRALKRIIKENNWATMLVSIENFQNYKETYTELASDKLIQTYCAIINSALSEKDFFGAFSENSFLIITDILKVEKIANYLTFAFDSIASKFYSQIDNRRGFMLMSGDEFAGRRSNFVHTTIGIVTSEFSQYNDFGHLLVSLLQTHKLADVSTKSNYLIKHPQISAENAVESAQNNKVFIIENDEAMSILLTTILDLQGYDVRNLPLDESFNDEIPALIILDAGSVGELKGLDLCKKIKSNPLYDKTKIIVTSILHDKELVLTSGADLYIPKPYEISNLVKWVEKLLDA